MLNEYDIKLLEEILLRPKYHEANLPGPDSVAQSDAILSTLFEIRTLLSLQIMQAIPPPVPTDRSPYVPRHDPIDGTN